MTLSEKQQEFTRLIALLIKESYDMGYKMTFGDAYRSPDTAKMNELQGKGIANSLHIIRLAIDLNLFLNGKYLTTKDEYLKVGELWESYSFGEITCTWGGRFVSGDANHFSLLHNGVR